MEDHLNDARNETNKVVNWLADLNDGEAANISSQSHPTVTNSKNLRSIPSTSESQGPPSTPLRQTRPYSQIEAFSPTGTTFSGYDESVFDAEEEQPDTPVTPGFRDGFDDQGKLGCENRRPYTQDNLRSSSPPGPETLASYEPSLTGSTTSFHVVSTSNTLLPPPPISSRIQPTRRLTQIVSCLQCTILNLPCSRTLPACTRCVRRGEGRECIVRRRQYIDEVRGVVQKGRLGYAWGPVILHGNLGEADRDEGTDDRARKLEELMQTWHTKQDQRNWVLPSPQTSPRGGYSKIRSWWQPTSPGEGKGAVRFIELSVVGAEQR